MSIRSLLLSASLIATTVTATPVFADADIIVQTAPPAVINETVPPPRVGYVWAPGYQRWENGTYMWTPGHWVEAKVHSRWVPDKWEQVDSNHWRFVSGHWVQE